MTRPRTSLLIASKDRPRLLRETIKSVLAGTELPDEIVVIDQSSRPDLAIAEWSSSRCEIRYRWVEWAGRSRANNTAIAAAGGDLLFFTDDDVLVAPDWFERLQAALAREGERAVVTGAVLPEQTGDTGGFVPSTKTWDAPQTYLGRVGRDVLFPPNMAMHRSTLDDVGRFDTRLGAAEDNDLGLRLLEAGYRIVYEPAAAVVHRAWRDDSHYIRLRWVYARGQGAYYAKHSSLRDAHMLRRLGSDVWGRLRDIPPLLPQRRREALGNAVYAAGVVSAAVEWWLRYGARRGPR